MAHLRTYIRKLVNDLGPGALLLSGISIVLTIAASSSWAKYAYLASAVLTLLGLTGLTRFDLSFRKSRLRRTIRNVFIFGTFAAVWIVVWRLIPKPPDVLTVNDIRNAVKDAMNAVASNQFFSHATKATPNVGLKTKRELMDDAVRQVFTETSRQYSIRPRPVFPEGPPTPVPEITSVPTIFQDGQIRGKNFGARQGSVVMHLRVKASAEQGPYSRATFQGPGPEKLLGNLDGTNYPLLGSNIAFEWHDDRIQLKFSPGFWGQVTYGINNVAGQRMIPPPLASDIEVGYIIETADGAKSEIAYQHD